MYIKTRYIKKTVRYVYTRQPLGHHKTKINNSDNNIVRQSSNYKLNPQKHVSASFL